LAEVEAEIANKQDSPISWSEGLHGCLSDNPELVEIAQQCEVERAMQTSPDELRKWTEEMQSRAEANIRPRGGAR
jgi:hypothetical protein